MKIHLLSFFSLLTWSLTAQLKEPLYFSQYTQGTGWSRFYTDILIGDINLDEIPDVIFTMAAGYQVGYGKMENGRITFDMLPIDYDKHGWWYYAGQLVDYDRDGDLDFLTASSNNFDYSRTYIMENNGGQLVDTFRHASPPYTDKALLWFGKFNDDAVDDLYSRRTMPINAQLFDGATGEEVAMPIDGAYMGFRDFNRDGLLDFYQQLVVSPTYQTGTDNFYINKGDYTYDRYETTRTFSQPVGQDTPPWGDFDGDGVEDYFARPQGEIGLSFVFKTNMQSQNEARLDTLRITSTQFMDTWVVMDATDDGTEDLIIFGQDSLYFIETDEDMQLNVHPIAGQWHPSMIRRHPDLPQGTCIAITGDGMPLLLEISYNENSGLIVREDYNAFFPFVLHRATYASPTTSVDLDADGQRELCFASEFAIAFAEIQSDQTLDEHFIQAGYDNFAARSVSSGDWNGDGHDDVFLCEGNRIYVAMREADSTLADRVYLTDGLLFDAHDFDRNGFDDLFIGMTDSIFILFNDQGAFVRQEILDFTKAFPEFNVFDPNHDGYPDIALSKDTTFVFMNQGDGTFTRSPFFIPGNLARHTIPNSSYLFTVLYQPQQGVFYYRPNLYRVLPDGSDFEWVNGHVLINTVINARESWLVNYDGDSIPDLLYNMQDVDSSSWQAFLINEQEQPHGIIYVPDSFILGAEDVVGDGAAEVIYVKGSKVYLEMGLPSTMTAVNDPGMTHSDVIIYPNPLPSGEPWTIACSNEYRGKVVIDIFSTDGRLWNRYEREKSVHRFESSFDAVPSANGSFYVRLTDDTTTVVKKVIMLHH